MKKSTYKITLIPWLFHKNREGRLCRRHNQGESIKLDSTLQQIIALPEFQKKRNHFLKRF